MTIDTSAALGTIAQLFAAGQYKNVQLGVGRDARARRAPTAACSSAARPTTS